MFGISKKTENEISVVFDIGNGSIGAALVKLSQQNLPIILYSYREEVPFHETMDSEKLLYLVDRLVGSVSAHISKEGILAVKKTHGAHKLHSAMCIFSAPWYVSQTKIVRVEKPKPFTVTQRYVEEVIRVEEERFEKEAISNDNGQLFHDGVVAIDQNIIQTKLNGYEVHDPYGKSTRSLELALFTSVVSKALLKKITDTINRSLHLKKIISHSFALASFTVIRDVFLHESSFISIDVSAEVTELSITKQGVLLENITFPSGKNSLIRSLSKSLKATPEVAFSLARMSTMKTTDSDVTSKIDKALLPFESQWCSFFHKATTDLSSQMALPRKVYLTCDEDVEVFFTRFIEKEKCVQFPDVASDNEELCGAIVLDVKKFERLCTVDKNTKSDSFLVLETVFLNKIFNL